MALAPFTQNVYVTICPYCINPDNLEAFQKLVRAGIITPILVAPYGKYPEPVIEAIKGLDHISCYEFSFYRYLALTLATDEGVCVHCIDKYEDEIISIVKGKRGAPSCREHLGIVLQNLHPFIAPDFELLDDVKAAFQSFDQEHISQLSDLSYTIRSTRTSQAFNAALTIKENEFSRLPKGIAEETDKARTATLELAKLVTEGLGLSIPIDIPTDNYIELITDFRPRIVSVLENAFSEAVNDVGELSVKNLLSTVYEINREIERVKGLKRHMLLEAIVGFVNNNRAFTVSTLVAGAMGLGGSLVGCAGSVTAGIVTDMARKSGKLRGNISMERLGRKIHRDLSPSMDTLIAKYVGSSGVPIHVLSIRKQISKK